MAKHKYWQIPIDTNLELGSDNRKVSWLELFFDIFFVCAIAAIGHLLVKDMSFPGLVKYVATFIPVWWIWIGFTLYNERFESFGLENRLFTFLMMVAVAGMAIFASHAMDSSFVPFVVSYIFARLILAFLYGRAGYHIDSFQRTGYAFFILFILSAICALCLAFLAPESWRLPGFGIILGFDLLIPFIVSILDNSLAENSDMGLSDKIDERFGLFCIIVIGELIVAIVSGIEVLEVIKPKDVFLGIASLALAFGMWWIYFDFIGRRGADKHPRKMYVWGYMHMPLVMSFVALSAGILYSIEHPGHLAENARLLIGISAGLSLLSMAIIENVSLLHQEEPINPKTSFIIKVLTGLACIAVAYFSHLEALPLVLFIFGMLAINMFYGLWCWFHIPEDSEYHTHYTG